MGQGEHGTHDLARATTHTLAAVDQLLGGRYLPGEVLLPPFRSLAPEVLIMAASPALSGAGALLHLLAEPGHLGRSQVLVHVPLGGAGGTPSLQGHAGHRGPFIDGAHLHDHLPGLRVGPGHVEDPFTSGERMLKHAREGADRLSGARAALHHDMGPLTDVLGDEPHDLQLVGPGEIREKPFLRVGGTGLLRCDLVLFGV